jgi:hypothetical protein
MFKFDFVQDGGDEQPKAAQSVKKEVNEPVLTEISLIELVRGLRLQMLKTVAFIPFAVGHFALSHFLLPVENPTIRGPSRDFSLSTRPL